MVCVTWVYYLLSTKFSFWENTLLNASKLQIFLEIKILRSILVFFPFPSNPSNPSNPMFFAMAQAAGAGEHQHGRTTQEAQGCALWDAEEAGGEEFLRDGWREEVGMEGLGEFSAFPNSVFFESGSVEGRLSFWGIGREKGGRLHAASFLKKNQEERDFFFRHLKASRLIVTPELQVSAKLMAWKRK